MPKKPLTPEQRERKRQRDREYYARKRQQAGLPYTPKVEPFKAAETITDKFLDAAKKALSPAKAPPKKKGKGRSKPRPPVPGVAFGPTIRKDLTSFERFVMDNPQITSARQALRMFREQTGQSIGDRRGYELFRNLRTDDKHFEKVRFKMYGPNDNPLRKNYLMPSRFLYFVRYEVEVEGHPETFTQYIHIQSRRQLTPAEIRDATIEAFQIGQEKGKERYIAKRIDPNSITILFGIDALKKSAS